MTNTKDMGEKKALKSTLNQVYSIGFRNGQIDIKYRILKAINRDWSLIAIRRPVDLVMKILKKVNALKVPKPKK